MKYAWISVKYVFAMDSEEIGFLQLLSCKQFSCSFYALNKVQYEKTSFGSGFTVLKWLELLQNVESDPKYISMLGAEFSNFGKMRFLPNINFTKKQYF